MYLTEQHIFNKNHPYYKRADEITFLSKNLYNSVLYLLRQIQIKYDLEYRKAVKTKSPLPPNPRFPNYNDLCKLFKRDENYKKLNTKCAQWVIKDTLNNFWTWKKALKSYYQNKSRFLGRPKLPNYKHKTNGRFLIRFTNQAISTKSLKCNKIKPSMTDWEVPFKKSGNIIRECRLVPYAHGYKFEIVYKSKIINKVTPDENGEVFVAGIDLGVNNIAAIAISSGKGLIYSGKNINYINQLYNKLIDKSKSKLHKKQHISHHVSALFNRRNNRIKSRMHKISCEIIKTLLKEHVYKVIIGKNDNWKQNINLGKQNNQKFSQIPHNQLINQLKYKAELVGIEVVITEEAYTSKASAIDTDQLFSYNNKVNYQFSGNRKYRGLYISKNGIHCNADINGACNIIRKVIQDSSLKGSWIRGCVVSPVSEHVNYG